MWLGGTGSWEGTQQGQSIPHGQRDIPDCMVLCPVYKLGAKLFGAAVQELAGLRSGDGEKLHCALLLFVFYILLL